LTGTRINVFDDIWGLLLKLTQGILNIKRANEKNEADDNAHLDGWAY